MANRQIFLSYSHEDKVKVRSLYEKLSAAGFQPWMDVENILPGQSWPEALEEAIRASDFFLACLSNSSVGRTGVLKRELKWALGTWQKRGKSDIYLIPVRLEACKTPRSLERFQWVDLYELGGWDRLLRALQSRTGDRQGEEAKDSGESTEPPDRPAPAYVMVIVFELNGRIERFDEEEFKAALRDLVGTDITKVRITSIRPGSVRVTVEGDGEELTRIIESLRNSEKLQRTFSARTGLTSVSYVREGERDSFQVSTPQGDARRTLGVGIGFVVGVFGNLLADLIRQGWFSNPFTLPQAAVIILMALAGLGASIWLPRWHFPLPKLSRFRLRHELLTTVLAIVLLALPVAILLSMKLRESFVGTRNCSEVRVSGLEFHLSAEQLKYSGSEPITLRYSDLYNRQNLAGRAVLVGFNEREQCMCEWWGETSKLPRQQLSPLNDARACFVSVPFEDSVTEINLTLNVGRRVGTSGFEQVKSFDFKIKVQR